MKFGSIWVHLFGLPIWGRSISGRFDVPWTRLYSTSHGLRDELTVLYCILRYRTCSKKKKRPPLKLPIFPTRMTNIVLMTEDVVRAPRSAGKSSCAKQTSRACRIDDTLDTFRLRAGDRKHIRARAPPSTVSRCGKLKFLEDSLKKKTKKHNKIGERKEKHTIAFGPLQPRQHD